MLKNISLKTQTFVLLVMLMLLATVPLVWYYLQTTSGLTRLGTDQQIENSLVRSVEYSTNPQVQQESATALKKYRQIKVLKDQIVSQVLLFSILYSVTVIIFASLIGYFFISKITRPIVRLTEATRQIAQENLDVRLDHMSGSGEVGRLVSAFNTMADNLTIARQQLSIAERRATWQHVARTIAHEIKNPLTPIKLSTERMYDKFLNESKDFPAVIKSTTETILTEIANLQKLVDTFHKYAKFPDPLLRPEKINDILAEVAALHAGQLVPVRLEAADGIPVLNLDKGQIREALNNLVKNGIEAIESAERPGSVTIRSTVNGTGICVSIADNGCGIPAENKSRLFQPYFTTKKHGNGIGLALTERIVTLNGGKITVESEEGKGTVFTLIFPTG